MKYNYSFLYEGMEEMTKQQLQVFFFKMDTFSVLEEKEMER